MDLYSVDLPKWPAMVVVGQDVSEAQAAEVILRTDIAPNFSLAGNNKSYAALLQDLFPFKGEDFAQVREFKKKHGILDLEYLTNRRIISSWVGGPHGWMNWNGKVFSNTYNIGKHPDAEEVYEEWVLIANSFPFLDLKCQLFSGEVSEETIEPVIEFHVSGGKVTYYEPKEVLESPEFHFNFDDLFTTERERGITYLDLRKKINQVFSI